MAYSSWGKSILLAGAIAGATCLPAAADVLKSVESGKNVLYITGNAANAAVQISTTGVTNSAVLSNPCGLLKVAKPAAGWTANPTVNGAAVDFASLAVGSVPACAAGVLTPAPAGNFKDASDNVYVIGLAASTAQTVGKPSTSTRSDNANGCGIAKFTESATSPFSAFTFSATSYDFAAITGLSFPIKCLNVGTTAAPVWKEYRAN